jgi:hypothetical protein
MQAIMGTKEDYDTTQTLPLLLSLPSLLNHSNTCPVESPQSQ